MATHARPLSTDDLGSLLKLDEAYAQGYRLEPVVSHASLHFFARSGHAFVAVEPVADGPARLTGFVLAQAVWGGDRAVVRAQRLVAGGPDSARALLRSLTKSAYDAGVYDIQVELPGADPELHAVLAGESYDRLRLVVYARGLGSRAAVVKRRAAAEAPGG